jgi:hypothetical protein
MGYLGLLYQQVEEVAIRLGQHRGASTEPPIVIGGEER